MFGIGDEARRELKLDDAGKLLLRVTVAGLMLFHGVDKAVNGIEGISGMLAGKGLPAFLAYGVYVGELIVPVLMILGLFTRISSLIFAFNMLVAIGLAHSADIFSVGSHGQWAIELPAFYLFGALVIVLLGPGRYAIPPRTGWKA